MAGKYAPLPVKSLVLHGSTPRKNQILKVGKTLDSYYKEPLTVPEAKIRNSVWSIEWIWAGRKTEAVIEPHTGRICFSKYVGKYLTGGGGAVRVSKTLQFAM